MNMNMEDAVAFQAPGGLFHQSARPMIPGLPMAAQGYARALDKIDDA